jgi:hypothetical protein
MWTHANNNKEDQNLGLSMPLMWKHFYSQWCNLFNFLLTLVWNSCYWLCFFFSHVVSIWNYKGEQEKKNLNILICKNNIVTIKSYWKWFTFKCQQFSIKNMPFHKDILQVFRHIHQVVNMWKHTMMTLKFGVSHCTTFQGCACLNVSHLKSLKEFHNIFAYYVRI